MKTYVHPAQCANRLNCVCKRKFKGWPLWKSRLVNQIQRLSDQVTSGAYTSSNGLGSGKGTRKFLVRYIGHHPWENNIDIENKWDTGKE